MGRDEMRPEEALDRFWDGLIRGRLSPGDEAAVAPELRRIARGLRDLTPQTRVFADVEAAWQEFTERPGVKLATATRDERFGELRSEPTSVSRNGREPIVVGSIEPGRRSWRVLRRELALVALLAITFASLVSAIVALRQQDGRFSLGIGAASFRGGPARTGRFEGPALDGVPSLRWTFTPRLPVHPSLAAAGDTVYVAGNDDALSALDAATGVERWRFAPGFRLIGMPTVAEGVVYVGSREGLLFAVDAATGTERWRAPLDGEICCSPAVVDDVVYVGSGGGGFYAVDAVTGKEIWEFRIDGASWSSPAVANGIVYAGTDRRTLYALDVATGRERWRFRVAGSTVAAPAVADGIVYVASWNGALYALDAATGEERWRFVSDASIYAPAVGDGLIYAGGEGGALYALDAATGAERWRVETGERIRSQPALAGGVLYVGSYNGFLYAIDAATGTERWRFGAAPFDFGPVVEDGSLYFAAHDGRIWAVTGGEGPPSAATPIATPVCNCGPQSPWVR